ncbi:hypothetical protein MKW92_044883, partial [Papaver armeniacum]
QASNNKKFPNFPYGRLNSKMKAPSPKTTRRSCMHEYTPTTHAVGESSTHHQEKDEEAGQEQQQEKQERGHHQRDRPRSTTEDEP